MSYLCPHYCSFPLEDYCCRVSGENARSGGAQFVEKYDWKQPNRLLVVQTGDSIEQANVFKARAVPQCLCANLITALRLLANQQEYGDGLSQNIVKNLGLESRRGFTDGLRDFIEVDNERPGCWSATPGHGTDVIVRESLDELTLRAEEVNTSKALINVNHIEPERWGPPLVDADWFAFFQALYKGIEGEDWEDMYDSYKEMSKAVSVRQPQEAQKAKALWALKAAKDREEEFSIRLAKRTFREETERDWSCGKNISRIRLLR